MFFSSSFMLYILLCETAPLISTVWFTWLARSTELLPCISHVLPSAAVNVYSFLPALVRHPVMVRTAALEFASESESCATAQAVVRPASNAHNSKRLNFDIRLLLCRAPVGT